MRKDKLGEADSALSSLNDEIAQCVNASSKPDLIKKSLRLDSIQERAV
jgi:hypothetical protein